MLLAVDTASSDTVVSPGSVDLLGYGARDGEYVMTVRSAIGREHGWTLRVKRFSAHGFVIPDYRVHVFDLATGDDIDGLIGLTFLDQFNYEVRFQEGRAACGARRKRPVAPEATISCGRAPSSWQALGYPQGAGGGGPTLALHAEFLAFTHPHIQRRIEFVRPAPF